MITASLRDHLPRMAPPERKDGFRELLGELCLECRVVIVAWVILNDHYHALLCPDSADQMGRILGRLHRICAGRWNREDGTEGRPVWYQHWDRVMRSEGDAYSRINYIHRNPVKHGYVKDPADWPWSSYRVFAAAEDPEIAARLQRFPAPLRLPGD